MIVLLWSRATRDLLKSFGWGAQTVPQPGSMEWLEAQKNKG